MDDDFLARFLQAGSSARRYGRDPVFRAHDQVLLLEDPTPPATPASKSAIEALLTVSVDKAENCAVCKDELGLGISVLKMPCQHLFHHNCLLPWLEANNTCPLCRFELSTDDDLIVPTWLFGSGEEFGSVGGENADRSTIDWNPEDP